LQSTNPSDIKVRYTVICNIYSRKWCYRGLATYWGRSECESQSEYLTAKFCVIFLSNLQTIILEQTQIRPRPLQSTFHNIFIY